MQTTLLHHLHFFRHTVIIGVMLFMVAPFVLNATDATVIVTDTLQPLVLSSEHSSLADDPTRALGIAMVASPLFADQFQALEQIGTSVFTQSAVWWRITVSNQTGEPCFLHLHSIGTDTIDVYVPKAAGDGFHHLRFGHLVQVPQGFAANDWQAGVELPQLGERPTTIYIRKVARYAMFFYASVGTSRASVQSNKERSMFNAAFLGIGCALILYNLFIFISLRSRSYLYYLCYLVLFFLHHIFMMGKLEWIFGSYGAMIVHQYWLTTLSSLASMAMIWFTGQFLHVWRYSRIAYKVLGIVFYCQFGIIALEIIGIFFPPAAFVSRQCISLNAGIMSLICVASAVVVYRRGNRGARFFLLGWTFWILTLIYLICMTLGLIPTSTFGVYHLLQIGAASEMLLMAIALADRINTFRREKESVLRENTYLVEQQNIALESRVLARTTELELAYDALVSANHAIEQQVKFQNIQNGRIQEKNIQLEQQNKQLHLLNEEKSNLLSIVAHDLKNPLSSIIFAAESTRHLLRSVPPKEVHVEERFLRIESAAERMYGIITNLLNVHTLETGQIQIIPEKFDVVLLVNAIVQGYTEQAAAKNISINFHADEALPIHSDRSIISEILDNLLSNALKYSPPERNVYISVLTEKKNSFINTSAYSFLSRYRSLSEQCFLVAISDEGPGMTEEDKTKLFTKFARLSARPTGGESSTGLGLAIVKKFVDLLRGTIWCESEYGSGTTFYVTLPVDVIQRNQQYN